MGSFEPAVGTASGWLCELSRELGSTGDHDARHALQATLHALRDYLTVSEAAQFAGQLPLILRGLFYEGWTPAPSPKRLVGVGPFLNSLREHNGGPLDSRRVARAVFKLFHHRAQRGEVEALDRILPAALLKLWPTRVEDPTRIDREPTVSNVMTRSVFYSIPDRSLQQVIDRMDEERIRHLLVVSSPDLEQEGATVPEQAILGLLSNRDLLRHLRQRPAGCIRLDRLRVSDIMTPSPLHSIPSQAPLSTAAEDMLRYQISALPVLEGGELVGLVTSEDLLEAAYPLPSPVQ